MNETLNTEKHCDIHRSPVKFHRNSPIRGIWKQEVVRNNTEHMRHIDIAHTTVYLFLWK